MRQVQKFISIGFIILLVLTFIINMSTLRKMGENPFSFQNLSLLLFSFVFILLMLDKAISRYMQAFIIMIIAFLSLFIDNGFDRIWGWGLFGVSYLLLSFYGFFDFNAIRRVLLIIVLFLSSIFFSVTAQGLKWEKTVGSLVYLIAVGGICSLLYKAKMNELDIQRKKLDSEIESIQQEKELLQSEWTLLNNELTAEKESYKEKERALRLREEILVKAEQSLHNSIEDFCHANSFDSISTTIIVIFFDSRGSATNKFIASEMGIAEQTVKNKLFTIYKKLNVTSRSQLISKLDSIVAKNLYQG